MRTFTIFSVGAAGLALAADAARADSLTVAIFSLALSAFWILAETRGRTRATLFLTGFAVLSGIQASSGSGFLLPALAVVAALHGWDASLAAARMADLPREDCRRITHRYAVTSVVLAASSLALVAASASLRVSLAFGGAVALAVALVVVSTAIGVLSRPRRGEPVIEAEATSEPEKEKAGRQLSPDLDVPENG